MLVIKEDWALRDSKERWVWKESPDQLGLGAILAQEYDNMAIIFNQSDCIIYRVPQGQLDILELMGRRDQLVITEQLYVILCYYSN